MRAQSHSSGVNEPVAITDPELGRLLAVIVEDFAPIEVILFGSQARGDARPDSDFDVAVIMPEGTHRRHTAGRIYLALGRVHGRTRGIDVVVFNVGEVERGRDDIGTVAREIARDGRTIYRRPVAVGV
jgi:predicted nucleotidyltransferase